MRQNYNDHDYSDPINNIMRVYYKHNKTNLMDEIEYLNLQLNMK